MTDNASTPTTDPTDVLAFWRAAGPDKWFSKDAAFDAEVAARFFALWEAAATGGFDRWEETPETALALVIVLDQFPRNMFRGEARAFASDARARAVAERALARGFDQRVPSGQRHFFYLPFEHSEVLADQHRALSLCEATGDADLLKWAKVHADIIRRFGRFPHRNALLGRATTAAEQEFLDQGGFAG
jgi:uncharacterized protein (DUF924 family)